MPTRLAVALMILVRRVVQAGMNGNGSEALVLINEAVPYFVSTTMLLTGSALWASLWWWRVRRKEPTS